MDTAKPQLISIVPIKDFVRKKFNSNQILYEFILEDRDFIPVDEFILKCKIWLQLVDKEAKHVDH